MEIDFNRGSRLMKALSDETRARIVHILSCGELCACEIQPYFALSQPTLSHHLAILVESGLIESRPEGKWVQYRLSRETAHFLTGFTAAITTESETCQCRTATPSCGAEHKEFI